MGYFDGLAEAIFKKTSDGRSIFYPWGILGKGYIVPDAMTKQKLINFTKRQYIVLLPFVIGVGVFVGWIWACVLLPVYFLWYLFAISKMTEGLQVTNTKLKISQSLRNSAMFHNIILVWFMFVFSILFVLGSIAILSGLVTSSDGYLVGLLGFLFFGLCSIAFGYMIKSRKHKKKR